MVLKFGTRIHFHFPSNRLSLKKSFGSSFTEKYVENRFPYRLLWGRGGGGSLSLLHSLASDVTLYIGQRKQCTAFSDQWLPLLKFSHYCFRPRVVVFLLSDLNYHWKMSWGKCSFRMSLFSMKEYSSWFAESSTIYSAKCNLCRKDFDIANMDEDGLKPHTAAKTFRSLNLFYNFLYKKLF